MTEQYSNPISYVLNHMLNKQQVSEFDIRNAIDHWNKIQNQKPVAYALDNGDGDLYDLRKYDNPFNNRYKVVPLYRNY